MRRNIAPIVIAGVLLFGSGEACNDAGMNRPAATYQDPQSILDQYVPELSQAGLRPRETIDFGTYLAEPTKIFNYTDFNLDKDALGAIYKYFENFPKANTHLISPQMKYDLSLEARQVKSRTMVVLPSYIPKPPFFNLRSGEPSLGQDFVSTAGAETAYTNDFVLTYLNPQLLSRGGYASQYVEGEGVPMGFTVEICQQTINVHLIDGNGKLVSDPQLNVIGQELFCNSLGYAVLASSLGWTYSHYSENVGIHKSGPFASMLFNQSTYNSMPKSKIIR